MAERASALAHLPLDRPAGSAVTLSEVRVGSILQVAAWPDTGDRVEAALTDMLAVLAPRLGFALVRDDIVLASTAPGRYLIAADADDLPQRFEAALPSADAAVTDLSHGRTILRLEGPAAASVLAQCVAIDLHPAAFPDNRCAQTMIHHIDVLIIRRAEEAFDLWALRGFAEALAEWILDAAAAG